MKLQRLIKLFGLLAIALFAIRWTNFLSDKGEINSLRFIYKLPISTVVEKGKVVPFYLIDTTGICDYLDFRVIRLPPVILFETGENIKNSEPYFVFQKNEKYGIYYSNLKNDSTYKRCSVDSILTNKNLIEYPVIVDTSWKLIESKKTASGDLVERYYANKPICEWSVDTLSLFYGKTLNIPDYSLSRKMDSLKNLKFMKVAVSYKGYITDDKMEIPRREISIEVENYEESHPDDIKMLVERYKRQSK